MSIHTKPTNFGKSIPKRHLAVVKTLGYSLKLMDEQAMWTLAAIIYARLHPNERVFNAVAAIMGLDDAEYEAVIRFVEG